VGRVESDKLVGARAREGTYRGEQKTILAMAEGLSIAEKYYGDQENVNNPAN